MPPRPTGTDGSDYAFREVIDNKYKTLALFRTGGWILLNTLAFPIALRTAWHFVPYITDGAMPDIKALSTAVMYIAAIICWKLAKPATTRESLTMVKTTNVLAMGILAMHVVYMYRYHFMSTKQQLYPRRLYKFLMDEHGITNINVQHAFTVLEAILDSLTFLMGGGCTFCLHRYIMDRMEKNKQLSQNVKNEDKVADEYAKRESAAMAALRPSAPKAPAGARKRLGRL